MGIERTAHEGVDMSVDTARRRTFKRCTIALARATSAGVSVVEVGRMGIEGTAHEGVDMSVDTARRSACATSAATSKVE